jgi:hypothetical protein
LPQKGRLLRLLLSIWLLLAAAVVEPELPRQQNLVALVPVDFVLVPGYQ